MFALHNVLQEMQHQHQEIYEIQVPRVIARVRSDPLLVLTEEEFVQRYRLSKDAVLDLLGQLHPIAPKIISGRGT